MSNCYASKVVEVAKSQLGVKETGTNITKYSADFDNLYPDFYNTRKQGAEWCDIFADWCMVTAFGVESVKVGMGFDSAMSQVAATMGYSVEELEER